MLPISISGFADTKVKAAIFKVGEVVRYSTLDPPKLYYEDYEGFFGYRFVSSKEIKVSTIPTA